MTPTAPHTFLTDPVAIHEWLDTHCAILPSAYRIEDGIINVDGDVYLKTTFDARYQHLSVQFGKVTGCFDVGYCQFLTSLAGCPREVGESFSCTGCRNLLTLEGGPVVVGETYSCVACPSLKTLAGAPSIAKQFNCSGCRGLKSLQGAPATITDWFNCSNCTSLISLKGGPSRVEGSYSCTECAIATLSDFTATVGTFLCSTNAITSLAGDYTVLTRMDAVENIIKDLTNCTAEINELSLSAYGPLCLPEHPLRIQVLNHPKLVKPTAEQFWWLLQASTQINPPRHIDFLNVQNPCGEILLPMAIPEWWDVLNDYYATGDFLSLAEAYESWYKQPLPVIDNAMPDYVSL